MHALYHGRAHAFCLTRPSLESRATVVSGASRVGDRVPVPDHLVRDGSQRHRQRPQRRRRRRRQGNDEVVVVQQASGPRDMVRRRRLGTAHERVELVNGCRGGPAGAHGGRVHQAEQRVRCRRREGGAIIRVVLATGVLLRLVVQQRCSLILLLLIARGRLLQVP